MQERTLIAYKGDVTEFWFDTRCGDLVVGQAALALRMEEAGPAVVPLSMLLQAPDFPYKTGDFTPLNATGWRQSDYVNFGRWMLQAAQEPYNTEPTTTLDRLRVLGLGPALTWLGRSAAYNWELAIPPDTINTSHEIPYADLEYQQLIEQATALAEQLQHKPTRPDYIAAARRGEIAGYGHILRLVGGIRQLNEHIGFPDYTAWEEPDFIAYGIRFVMTNGPSLLLPDMFDMIARRDRGPWTRSITTRFDSWQEYKTTVLEQYADSTTRLAGYHKRLEAGTLPEYLRELPPTQLLQAASKYLIIEDCAKEIPPGKRPGIIFGKTETFAERVARRGKPHVTPGYVEMAAVSHGVFDYIWPPSTLPYEPDEHIRITDQDIDKLADIRGRRSVRQQVYRTNRKQAARPHIPRTIFAPAHVSAYGPAQNNGQSHARQCA